MGWMCGRLGGMALAQRRIDVRRFRARATRMGSFPLICRPLGKSWLGLMWMYRRSKGRSRLIDGDVAEGNSRLEGRRRSYLISIFIGLEDHEFLK